ncbi:transposase [Streptomyces flaveolus]|uniref:transposase n=1 Tax=Streptomyces flaveolus TaxID=67297 RepID=UPI00167074F5|nr:hypothetical protein GCM10010216_21990 [Streptomyces flaveolus]
MPAFATIQMPRYSRASSGLGVQLAVRVLAETGDNRNRFADARGLKAYAGFAPITRASGTKRYVGRRMVKRNRLRHVGCLWAFSSLRPSSRGAGPLPPPGRCR